MSLRLTLTCDGHVNRRHCTGSRTTVLAHSPHLRSDDPTRLHGLPTADMTDGWRIGGTPHGGDLCPYPHHDEDRAAQVAYAETVLAARRANEGLS
jgi:hypothetical protein